MLNEHKYIYKAVCKNSPGYLVKIPYKGKVIQKWFLNKTHGSDKLAFRAAIKWCDLSCEESGRNKYGIAWTKGKGMKGHAGIHLYKLKRNRKLKSGKKSSSISRVIRVTGARINGRLQKKDLYLSKFHNISEAFEQALKIRMHFIKEMNQARLK